MALVAVAALCMGVPACGRSVSTAQGQGSGIVSPTKGLVATTPAGSKPVQSVVWAVYRDVNSLDPIFAFDYPENTADSLMCESLLLQAPGGDPAALLSTVVLPDGTQNYDSFNDPKITSALEQARSTADPGKRAALVAQAEKLTVQQMPWIPNAQPTSLLVLNKSLTGAVSSFAYMFAPWANQLGGTG
jgi:ABC-type transport system substrate-binding protein